MITTICSLEESLKNKLQVLLKSKCDNVDILLRQYFNLKKKRISKIPRHVYLSSEIKSHALFLNEKKEVIERIIKNFIHGEDVNIYLSDKKDELNHTDLTLSVMGIHHLHLSDKIAISGKRKGLIKGTKSLLFVFINNLDVYFLDILTHGFTVGFLNKKLLRIIYRNWPEILAPYRINREGVNSVYEISDEDFSRLIQCGINIPYSPEDGVAYFLPGGLTAGKTDAENEIRVIRLLNRLNDAEILIKNNQYQMSKLIFDFTNINFGILEFSVEIIDDAFYIKNDNSGLLFSYENSKLILIGTCNK